ncbi:hypothetical protein [Aeromonas sobria]|uniref:hypothetical protein n=1 Tax=Aeromonas sobria TaxID=646 RepID=UPI0026EEF00F|nr:hypothetical protein [Aeromonas sobria]
MMETYDWPAEFRVRENTLALQTNHRSFESSWDGSEQTASTPGSKWLMELTMGRMEADIARRFEAFIAQLDGPSSRVRMWDFAHPLQSVHGAPIVSEALTMRTLFTSRGWTPSTLVLRRGDWIQIGDELKRVVADVQSDLSGAATVRVGPMLRNNYPSGSPLVVSRPMGVFRLDGAGAGKSRRLNARVRDLGTIKFVESFYP